MCSKKISAQSLHTGVGLIDSQHQTFFTILKKIRDLDAKDSNDELSYIIDELHLYTLYHFETEEALLEQHGLKSIAEHKAEHEQMTEKIEEFRLQNLTDSCILVKEMATYLENWLKRHIQQIDMKDLQIVNKKS